jgi:hypothetical protein
MTEKEVKKAVADADADFQKAQRFWRDGRPEYAELTAAIRKEVADEILLPAAAAAGVSTTEISELKTTRRQALAARPSAAEHPAAKKAADEANEKWAALEKKFAAARTPAERDEIEVQLLNSEDSRRLARRRETKTSVDAEFVATIKTIGLI